MSFSVSRLVTKPLSGLLRCTQGVGITNRAHQSSSFLQRAAYNGSTQRCFTRSLWYMSRSDDKSHKSFVKANTPCGCCGMHTDGDRELKDFLDTEIEYEQKNEKTPGNLPDINGFKVTKMDGSDVLLVRKKDDETVTLHFNVNHSVDEEFNDEEDPEQMEKEASMVSRPNFIVEIDKGTDEILHVQCAYGDERFKEEEVEEEGGYDLGIEIQEVAITKKGEEWRPVDYVVSGSNMDGNMYQMILNMLEERGIDEKTVDDIVTFATAYEHKQYIMFLKRLRNIAKK